MKLNIMPCILISRQNTVECLIKHPKNNNQNNLFTTSNLNKRKYFKMQLRFKIITIYAWLNSNTGNVSIAIYLK